MSFARAIDLAPTLRAQLLHLGSLVGPVGWIGLGALGVALVLAVVSRTQLDPANRLARSELAELEATLTRASAPGAALRNPTDAMMAVASQLPPADRMSVFIQEVQSRATGAGVQIDRTEYRVQSALGDRAFRLQMTMPAHGTYPQLRSWLEALLREHPSAALDELSLRREAEGAALLEAHVAFSYYSGAVR